MNGMNVAVVGCGHWGKNLVRNFSNLHSLAMVCDAQTERIEQLNRIANGIPFVSSVDEVWRSAVDGVVLATPAETHFELARQALEAGKDVFVEKPLALDFREGAELVKMAERAKRILMVGHVLEYHKAVTKLIELTRNGDLGKVCYIYSNRLSLGKVRREENILWSFAPHDIAVILRLLGQLPFQVSASGGNYIQPNVADVTVTNLLFNNGVRAHIFVSWLHPFKEQRLVVVGTEKMVAFDDVNKQLMLYPQKVELDNGFPVPVRGEGIRVPFDDVEPLREECLAFVSAMQTRTPPKTDGISGLKVLKVLNAAQRSLIMGGSPVMLQSDSEFME